MIEEVISVGKIDHQRVLMSMGYSEAKNAPVTICNQVAAIVESGPKKIQTITSIVPITIKTTGCISTACGAITSPTFNNLAQHADKVVYGVVTAGKQIDEILDNCEDTIDALIVDTYGSVLVEVGVDLLREKLASQTRLNISLPFSPGYCDYPLSEQENIFEALGGAPLGIKYHKDSFMMSPIKTISFIAALGEKELNTNPCSICSLEKCQMRR